MRDTWEGRGKLGVTEETGGSREYQRWGKRRGLLSILALLAAVGCDSSSSNNLEVYRDPYYRHPDYYGRNNYNRSPRRRHRYRRRRRRA